MNTFRKICIPLRRLIRKRMCKRKFHKHYPKYLAWSFISNTMSSMESVLGTHSMLSVVGKESTELAVSFNYIGKDLFGQIGGLWYMYRMGGESDKNPKRFIKKTMFTQQASIFLECATPLLPSSLFIPIAGLANIGKNISFTGLGSINAKVIQHMDSRKNVGEMYAKITTINTIASTIGMMIGLGITAYVPDHGTRLCIIPFITVLRLWTYKRSIKNLIDEF